MNGPEEGWTDRTTDDAEISAFEARFASAMRRVEPPVSFADAVMRRVQAGEQPPARVLNLPRRWRVSQAWAAGAVAAALLVGVSLQTLHRHQERSAATRQFDIATQIEQQVLKHTREQLSRNGISLDQ